MLIPSKSQKKEDPSLKVTQFHIMKHPTDTEPTTVQREPPDLLITCSRYLIPVPEELNNDPKLEEILWNFTRFDSERRLTLSRNPHFYIHLPTSSNVKWNEFKTTPTRENWHTPDTKPIRVLANTPGRVFLELCRNPRAFDNVWIANGTLIFKSKCRAFRFSSALTSFQVSVDGSRVKVLSKHPFNTAARGVTWSIWHRD